MCGGLGRYGSRGVLGCVGDWVVSGGVEVLVCMRVLGDIDVMGCGRDIMC